MTKYFDAIIIGTGQSGPALAQRFAKEGQRVAVVERKHFGGTCVNTGCVPTKTLVASAYVAHMVKRADEYGIRIDGDISVDMAAVKARKDGIVQAGTENIENWMRGLDGAEVFHGHARFIDNKTLEVNGKKLIADKIIINTGGRAIVPPIDGVQDIDILTNSSIMELDTLPDHLIVLGGSYIGLEFAQAFRRFGSRVTVIERGSRLIKREDPDISEAINDILSREGIVIECNAQISKLEDNGSGITATCTRNNQEFTIDGSHVLAALGRMPNTDDLGLDNTDITIDQRGFIKVDEQCRSSVPGIWAIGDVNGRGAFTHTSYNDFEIVAANIFDNDPRKISDRIPCYGLFIDPPLGRVGMTEQQARATGRNILISQRPMTSIGRARERGETEGFMKVLVDADTQKILGAAIIGINGDEVVHAFLDVMAADAPYTAISRTMHIHPTVSEYLPTILHDLEPLN